MAVVIDGTNGISSPDFEVDGVTGQLYPIVRGTAVTTTSGTSADFTGIPSRAKRITIMISGVSLTTTASALLVRFGSGSFEATGYVGGVGVTSSASSANALASTNGVYVIAPASAADTLHGVVVLTNVSGNIWMASGTAFRDSTGTDTGYMITSSKTTSGVLDRVQVVLDSTGAFDAGTINILYE
jgi:hypothetical protein